MARGERDAEALVEGGLIEEAELDGVDVELEGELVHGGLQREEAGDGAGAAHGGGVADVAAGEAAGDEQVRRAVDEGRDLAASFVVVVEE